MQLSLTCLRARMQWHRYSACIQPSTRPLILRLLRTRGSTISTARVRRVAIAARWRVVSRWLGTHRQERDQHVGDREREKRASSRRHDLDIVAIERGSRHRARSSPTQERDRAPRRRERVNEEARVSLTRRQYNAVSDVFRHSSRNSIASSFS